MNGFTKTFLLAIVAASASATKLEPARDGKSLLNTFPFNARNGQAANHRAGHHGHHDHHDHHDHHHEHDLGRLALPQTSFEARNQRQGGGEDEADLSIGAIAAAGERCIDKVVMQETTEYDDVITCKHSYSEKCHTTYTTDFEPQQEEECEETFTKSCFIEYKKQASEETIQFCHTPLICEGEGPEECKTVYESQCSTSYHVHEVEDDVVECEEVYEEKCEDVTQGYTTEQKCDKWPVTKCSPVQKQTNLKHTPQTECTKVPSQLCGPSSCVPEPGPEECFDKKETVVTKLVPLLKPQEECVDIPKEVCSRSRTNPRTVQKPVVKKWCYVPSEESGLA